MSPSPQSPPSHVAHIDICGQQYAVRSDLDPAYISQLAEYLDQKMRLAERESQNADLLRVTVIAALNIADELFRERAQNQGMEGRLLARAADIERLIDGALADAKKQAIA
jgi:cell division protein ZapA